MMFEQRGELSTLYYSRDETHLHCICRREFLSEDIGRRDNCDRI